MAAPTSLADQYDVVVIGGGGSGLIAAVEAGERGASVLVAEKWPAVGGKTGMAVGSITASQTQMQTAAGIEDDHESHFRDLLKLIPPDQSAENYDLELSRLMVERGSHALARLIELGVEFSGPHPEPPHSVYRMHNVVPNTGAFAEVLGPAAVERGATIAT